MNTSTFRISFQDLNYRRVLSLVRLMNFSQQAAGLDCAEIDMDHYNLNKRGVTWILLADSIRLTGELPGEYGHLKIETWSSGTRGARFTRETVFYGKNNTAEEWREIARGSSEWALIEMADATPLKPDSVADTEQIDGWSRNVIGLIERVPKLRQPEGDKVRLNAVPVFVSDLDSNRHVHNANYVRMGIDRLAEMLGLDARDTDLVIREFCIRFIAETKLGETLEWFAVETGEGEVWLEAREQMTDEVKVRLTLNYTIEPGHI